MRPATVCNLALTFDRWGEAHHADAIAAYDTDGKLVARAGEGSDGEPTLLGAVIAR